MTWLLRGSMTKIGGVEGLRTVLHVCVYIMVKGILVRSDINHQCYLYLQHYIGIYMYVLYVCINVCVWGREGGELICTWHSFSFPLMILCTRVAKPVWLMKLSTNIYCGCQNFIHEINFPINNVTVCTF